MELAGLEPATSWVRSRRRWGLGGTTGDGRAVSDPVSRSGFPLAPLLYSPQLTTSGGHSLAQTPSPAGHHLVSAVSGPSGGPDNRTAR